MKTNLQKNLADWTYTKLGDLFNITSSKRVFQDEWTAEGVPFYRAREIVKLSENGFVENDLFISRKMFEEYKTKYGVPQENDLLVTGVGTVGIVYRIIDRREFYFKDGNIIWFKSKGLASSAYIEQLYKSPITKNKLLGSSPITTVATYTIDAAKRAVVHLPPLPEQNRIVSVLETWDQSIEKLTKKIEIKQQIKKGLMDRFVFNRKDSSEYFIEDLFDLGRGRVIARGEIEKNAGIYPVYSSQTSNDGIFGSIDTYDFDGEYLTWTTDGAHAGRVFYRNGKFNCTNVCGTVKLKSGLQVNLYFVFSYLNYVTKNYVSYVGNPKLMNGVFGRIEIRLPNYAEQNKISEMLAIADREIERLEKKLSVIKDQKKFLLNNLITGMIRTPETLSAKS